MIRRGACGQHHSVSLELQFFRSPPPLPTIFLIGRDLTKTRGGRRGQIGPMIRFVRTFSAARMPTGLTPAAQLYKVVGVSIPFAENGLAISRGGKRRQKEKSLRGGTNGSRRAGKVADLVNLKSLRPQTGLCAGALPSVKKLLVVYVESLKNLTWGSLRSWILAQAALSQPFVLGRLSCLRGVVGMMHPVSGGVEAISSSCSGTSAIGTGSPAQPHLSHVGRSHCTPGRSWR